MNGNQHYDVYVLNCIDIWGWEWGFGEWLYPNFTNFFTNAQYLIGNYNLSSLELFGFFVLIVFFLIFMRVCFCFCLFKRTFVIGVRLLLWKTQKECMHNESKVSLYCYWILFDYLDKIFERLRLFLVRLNPDFLRTTNWIVIFNYNVIYLFCELERNTQHHKLLFHCVTCVMIRIST